MSSYDVVIIGAGMSGLAAGIRLAMFDKKVLILEKHTIPGGLNSYYQRRNAELGGVRLFDVGLHALTNYIKKGEKNKPFSKLLKQLRLSYDDFKLCPQTYSEINFEVEKLKFSNDFELLRSEVHAKFPHEIDNFEKLVNDVQSFNELDLNLKYSSSREKIKQFIKDELLIEMILCPLLIYGSSWEQDMDYAQFVIMFKSLYFEGFSRPEGGVRTIISLLMKRLEEVGGKIRFRTPVNSIKETMSGIELDCAGELIHATKVLSSIGLPETLRLVKNFELTHAPAIGKMTFLESIFVFDKKIDLKSQGSTIMFWNNGKTYNYKKPVEFFDPNSAVVCFPDHYESEKLDGEGTARVTFIASYDHWKSFDKNTYKDKKEIVSQSALSLVKKLTPGFDGNLRFQDTFTPTTLEQYTWHLNGTVYGSTEKSRDGKTPLKNLFVIGTDQGFLGIIGSMLSGISMSNLHGLMDSGELA